MNQGTIRPEGIRKRTKSPRKRAAVVMVGDQEKHTHLLQQLQRLKKGSTPPTSFPVFHEEPHNDIQMAPQSCDTVGSQELSTQADNACEGSQGMDIDPISNPDIHVVKPSTVVGLPPLKPIVQQYDSWKTLLPSLVEPLIRYVSSTSGVSVKPSDNIVKKCQSKDCPFKTQKVLCLYLEHCRTISITTCKCTTAPMELVKGGLFPAAPQAPRLAFSIELLEFYRVLFEQSCDAITSMAMALYKFYHRRGFPLLNTKGSRMQDPFRRGLTVAVQWYDALRTEIENKVDAAIASSTPAAVPTLVRSRKAIRSQTALVQQPTPLSRVSALGFEPSSTKPQFLSRLTPGQAAHMLRNRCPACFGHIDWGRPLENGGDVQVCLDGNFHHRHQAVAGDGPKVIDPTWLISKSQVDAVGCQVEAARKKPPKNYVRKVPDDAVAGCERSYQAADGDKKKAATPKFDDHGLVFLVCRHDVPLFWTNVDTPGEQQKYALALLQHLFSLLPPQATVSGLYDIACVVDRSIQLHELLPNSIQLRLQFATSVMHAYGHQWACQLIYNPRMRQGMGLTDGEGVERLWSRMRRLIGVERSQWRSKRLWLIDRQATSIATDLKNNLGSWLVRRHERGVQQQGNAAGVALHECNVPLKDLQDEWVAQVAAQTSVKTHAPVRLKKEIEQVLTLHDRIEGIEHDITSTKQEVKSAQDMSEEELSPSLKLLDELEAGHRSLTDMVERLYSSLNLPGSFPQLKDVLKLNFTEVLLLARDLKINIRNRAIGNFFELDKLDQAVGGKGQSLGTKLHQQTRNAISKRTPALIRSIKRFNKYCEMLKSFDLPKDQQIPLPSPLPLGIDALRKDATLMEDVWVTMPEGVKAKPRWLDDEKVRNGIRAMQKKQRCEEEAARLKLETFNLLVWYEQELRGMEGALKNPAYSHLKTLLTQRYHEHLQLPSTWASKFLSTQDFAQPDPSVGVQPTENLGAGLNETDYPEGQPQEVEDESQPPILDPVEVILGDIFQDAEIDDISAGVTDTEISYTKQSQFKLKEDPNPLDWGFTRLPHDLASPLKNVAFNAPAVERLKSPKGLLNDICINDGAQLLHAILLAAPAHASTANSCAILSTWDLPLIRQKLPDEDTWRAFKKSHCWGKKVWILPIHRPLEGHWVCCAIYPELGVVSLFDSLGSRQGWKEDVEDAIVLVKRVYLMAKARGFPVSTSLFNRSWTARFLVSEPLQHNNYDCGIWVLAFIASILRGYEALDICGKDITAFREKLYKTVLDLDGGISHKKNGSGQSSPKIT